MHRDTLAGAIAWGSVAGLLGTAVMDLIMFGVFALLGMPPALIYSFIGEVTRQSLLRIGIAMPGGALLGALVHFLLGLALGAVFGLATARIRPLRLSSIAKGALLGVLYIEIISQPLLAAAPLVVPMTTPELVQWYVLSTSMHLVYGIILGTALALRQRWLRKPDSGRQPDPT